LTSVQDSNVIVASIHADSNQQCHVPLCNVMMCYW